MLNLADPLWEKLDAAFCESTPELLSELAETWDDEKASSLFWDNLCHQDTCCGATYATAPHLLELARPEANGRQRLQIACFLGHVVICALRDWRSGPLPGMPETLADWDQERDGYRSLIATLEDQNRSTSEYEQSRLLPHYRRALAIEPVNAADLEKIQSIRAEFISSIPSIGSLCERALLEHAADKDWALCLLAGIAACDGLWGVAPSLNSGVEGLLRCSACRWPYEYSLYGDRVAIYSESAAYGEALAAGRSTWVGETDRAVEDYKDGAPSRCDGFIIPARGDEASDSRTLKLLSLADRSTSAALGLLLRCFLGRIACCKCGQQAAVEPF
jgi:hypothetical protein